MNELSLPNLVWGKTETDQRRHMQARIHFLNLLCAHLADQGVFLAWLHACDLRLPLRHAQLLQARLTTLRQGEEAGAQIEVTEELYREAVRDVVHGLEANASVLSGCVAAYVTKELRLDWHWLSAELTRAWFACVNASIFGYSSVELKIQYIPAKTPPTVAGRYPNGVLRKDQDVARYVEWFFRLHVKRESIRRVSLRKMDGDKYDFDGYKRGDVTKYAKLARTWLSFGFTDQNLMEIVTQQLPQGGGSTSPLLPGAKT